MKIPKGLKLSVWRAKIVYSKTSMKIPKGLNRRAKIVYSKKSIRYQSLKQES